MTLGGKYIIFLSLNLLIIAGLQPTSRDEVLLSYSWCSSKDEDSGDGYDGYEDEDEDYDDEDVMSGFEDQVEGDEEEEVEEIEEIDYGREIYPRPCTLAVQKIGTSNGDDDDDDGNKGDDIYVPQCTNTGDYEPRQCHKSVCWCVTRVGVEQKGSRHPDTEFKQCANYNPDIFKKAASTTSVSKNASFSSSHPAFLAAIVVMVVMGLAGAVLVAMFVVYRMRKKDEGSYALAHNSNSSAPERRSTRSLIFGTAIGGVGGAGGGGGGAKEVGHVPDPHFYSQQLQQPLQQEFYA